MDPLAEKIFDWTPYNYGMNNPAKMIDKGGEYAVSVHYELTYSTLISMGYSKAEADKIAHYSSTYADHPSGNVLVADWFSGVHWRTYGYRKGINYDAIYKSQDAPPNLL